MQSIHGIASGLDVDARLLLPAHRLATPVNETADEKAMWTHFGFRDGISRIGIEGWTKDAEMQKCKRGARHAAGEFVPGHPQNSGANPWISGPDTRVLPEEVRSFFRNG